MKLLKLNRKTRFPFVAYCAMTVCFCFATPVRADGDPIRVVSNLSDSILGLIHVTNMILLGFGVVQVGLSLKSHDPLQRADGFLTVAGGIAMMFAKEILNITVGG